jgi:hypothetical protein
MNISKIILISFLIATISCQSYNKKTDDFNHYLMTRHHTNLQNKVYVIIPLNICGSCVDKIINMVHLYPKNLSKLTIILTDYTSITIKNKIKELPDIQVLKDNRMYIVKDHVINGDKIIIIKVADKQIANILPYLVGENENRIKEILSNI